jgi:hypothetical protein
MNRRNFFYVSSSAAAGVLIPSLRAESSEATIESLPVTTGADAILYVAKNGNDRNPGSQQKPFATLGRAREAVRELKKRTKGPITVQVREGTYYLPQPLTFEPVDSGAAERPITYVASEGEAVTLSGGRKLDCRWEPYRSGIMRCELPAVRAGQLDFTQLFVDGKRQIRARFPKYDAKNPLVWGGSGYVDVPSNDESWPPTEFHFDPATFTKRKWAKPSEAVVHMFPHSYWGNMQWQVKDIDWDAHCVKLGWGGFQINELVWGKSTSGLGLSQLYEGAFRSRFFIENVFEELDAPGEWYLDKEAGVLYYMPAEGVDLKTAAIEVPVLEHAVEFRGSQRNPVRHVVLSGFRIAHTASTFFNEYEAPSLGDFTIHRGGAVFFDGAEDCGVEKCFFDAVGGNGVFINNYNRRLRVYGNKITEAGDNAVCLVGSQRSTQGTNRPYPIENSISNNLIHDCGILTKGVSGVFMSISEKNTVSHNVIYNMPRSAITVNDPWGCGHLIEFNHFHHTGRETQDHGVLGSWGRTRFWCYEQNHGDFSHGSGFHENEKDYVFYYPEEDGYISIVRNNYIEDTFTNLQCIDLDDGSSHYHIYNNLCVGMSLQAACGDYRTIENNIFVNASAPVNFWSGYEYNHDRFIRNIVVTSTAAKNKTGDVYKIDIPPLQGPFLQELDYNLLFSDAGKFIAAHTPRKGSTTHYTLEQWQALGYDKHSQYADPMFVDPGNGDYRLKPESPAHELGFKAFDISSVGLLPDFPKQWRE